MAFFTRNMHDFAVPKKLVDLSHLFWVINQGAPNHQTLGGFRTFVAVLGIDSKNAVFWVKKVTTDNDGTYPEFQNFWICSKKSCIDYCAYCTPAVFLKRTSLLYRQPSPCGSLQPSWLSGYVTELLWVDVPVEDGLWGGEIRTVGWGDCLDDWSHWVYLHAIDDPVVQFFLEDAWEKWKLS